MSVATTHDGSASPPRPQRTFADHAAAFAVRYRRQVLVAWLILLLAAAPLAISLKGSLSGAGWAASGSESEQVRHELRHDFPQVGAEAAVVVVQVPAATARDTAVAAVLAVLKDRPVVAGVTDPRAHGVTGLLSGDGRTALIPVQLSASEDADRPHAAQEVAHLVDTADLPAGTTADVTGEWAMWSDFNESNEKAMIKADILSGVPMMIMLFFVFGSLVAAGMPMMLTMVGIGVSYGILRLVAFVLPLSVWSMNMSMMIGMALGIDYALFMMTRYRAERRRGQDVEAALATTLATSGKAIMLSSLALVMAIGTVLVLPVMVFRSMALAMIVAVLIVVLAALTLLPAALAAVGDRALRGRVQGGGRSEVRWRAWSLRVVRRPVLGLAVGVLVLGGLMAPVAGVELNMPGARVVDTGYDSRDGYDRLVEAFGPGAGSTVFVTVPESDSGKAIDIASGVTGTNAVDRVSQQAASGRTVLRVTPQTGIDDSRTGELVRELRAGLDAAGLEARVGGPAAQNVDMTAALSASAPWIITLVLVLSFVMMLLVFRSLAIALLSCVMNLFTVGAAFGIAALIFQHGVAAALIGIEPQGFINAWAPVFFFVILFGLSMDYQLFLLASIREKYELTGQTRDAVRDGIAATGRPITNAAIIMVIVFVAFGVTGPLPPTELGITLASAIILDATVVRMLIVPAALAAFGEHTWWLPRQLERLLPKFTFKH
ncbi:MMPL family transporter [Kribbella deserti]|uniref:MMPL family transporter n=1 Tax=Kribbella deserti TaxID=1926257 RepID=A0ABV6QMY1_9ACTN